jgi:hypothetical protein
MSFVKDNGGPIALGVLAFAIIFGYIELRAPRMVESAVHTELVEVKEDIDKVDVKVERLIGILLEED